KTLSIACWAKSPSPPYPSTSDDISDLGFWISDLQPEACGRALAQRAIVHSVSRSCALWTLPMHCVVPLSSEVPILTTKYDGRAGTRVPTLIAGTTEISKNYQFPPVCG